MTMTGFEARMYLLSVQEGGRRFPVKSGYRPQWDFGRQELLPTFDAGEMTLVERETLEPGEECRVTSRLAFVDDFLKGRITPGLEFGIYEGLRMVGRGVVETII